MVYQDVLQNCEKWVHAFAKVLEVWESKGFLLLVPGMWDIEILARAIFLSSLILMLLMSTLSGLGDLWTHGYTQFFQVYVTYKDQEKVESVYLGPELQGIISL